MKAIKFALLFFVLISIINYSDAQVIDYPGSESPISSCTYSDYYDCTDTILQGCSTSNFACDTTQDPSTCPDDVCIIGVSERGGWCNSDSACGSDYDACMNEADKCVADRPNRLWCVSGVQCESGTCRNGICSPPTLSDGAPCSVNTDCNNLCISDADGSGKYCCSTDCVYGGVCYGINGVANGDYCTNSGWADQKSDSSSCNYDSECSNSCISDADGSGKYCCSTDCVYGDVCYDIGDTLTDELIMCTDSGWSSINKGYDNVCGSESSLKSCTENSCDGTIYEYIGDTKHFTVDKGDKIFEDMSLLVPGKTYTLTMGEWDEDDSNSEEITQCLNGECKSPGANNNNGWQAIISTYNIPLDTDVSAVDFDIEHNDGTGWWGYCDVKISSENANWCDTSSDLCVPDYAEASPCVKDTQCDFYGNSCYDDGDGSGSFCCPVDCVYNGECLAEGSRNPSEYCDGKSWQDQKPDTDTNSNQACQNVYECESFNCVPDASPDSELSFCCSTNCVFNANCFEIGETLENEGVQFLCEDGGWSTTSIVAGWSTQTKLTDGGENVRPSVKAFSSFAKILYEKILDSQFYLSKLFETQFDLFGAQTPVSVTNHLQSSANARIDGESNSEIIFSRNSNEVVYKNTDTKKEFVVSSAEATTKPRIARNGNNLIVVWKVGSTVFARACTGNPCVNWLGEEEVYSGSSIKNIDVLAYESKFAIALIDIVDEGGTSADKVIVIDIEDISDFSKNKISEFIPPKAILSGPILSASENELIIVYGAEDLSTNTQQLYGVIRLFDETEWTREPEWITSGLRCVQNVNPSASEQSQAPLVSWNVEGNDPGIFESQYVSSVQNPDNGVWLPPRNLEEIGADVLLSVDVSEPASMSFCEISGNSLVTDCTNMFFDEDSSTLRNYYSLEPGDYVMDYIISDRAGNTVSGTSSFKVMSKSTSWC